MDERQTPIFSSREEDPDLREGLDRFVVGLAERVDALQDTHAGGAWSELGQRCAQLAEEAQALGFAPLAHAAREVVAACAEEKAEAAEHALLAVTDVARRIRLGHRGAF
jgi:hypothetical protein